MGVYAIKEMAVVWESASEIIICRVLCLVSGIY